MALIIKWLGYHTELKYLYFRIFFNISYTFSKMVSYIKLTKIHMDMDRRNPFKIAIIVIVFIVQGDYN